MRTNSNGFTLIELLTSMAIGMVVMGGIIGSYKAQQQARTSQQMVVDMQQGARAAMALMRREIRMSNYDPLAYDGLDNNGNGNRDEAAESSVQGFLVAGAASVGFTLDLTGGPGPDYGPDGDDNDENEDITYQLNPDATLVRRGKTSGGFSIVTFDVDALAFAYAVDTDNDGMLDTYSGDVSGPVIWLFDSNGNGDLDRHLDTDNDGQINASDAAGGRDATAAETGLSSYPALNQIRAVRIWLLARTRAPIPNHLENETYVVGGQHLTPGDRYKRILFSSIVQCRNPQ